jgi:hypothetical protein
MTPDAVSRSVRRLGVLTTALGSQLPGVSFFLGWAPPGFSAVTLLCGGGAVAIFLLRFSKPNAGPDGVRRGARAVAVAIILAMVYCFLFSYVTVGSPAPRTERARYQVGFGLATFSLTDVASAFAKEHPDYTKEDLMLAFGAYTDGATSRIWKTWSIFTAGGALTVLFALTYYSWTSGLAWLAHSLKSPGRRRAAAS